MGTVGSVGTVETEIREYCKGRQNSKSLNQYTVIWMPEDAQGCPRASPEVARGCLRMPEDALGPVPRRPEGAQGGPRMPVDALGPFPRRPKGARGGPRRPKGAQGGPRASNLAQ